MTKRELIHQHALRCRPSKRGVYVTTHEALLAGADKFKGDRVYRCGACSGTGGNGNCDYCGGIGLRRQCKREECYEYGCGGYGTCSLNLAEAEYLQQTERRSLWQIIKGWFA